MTTLTLQLELPDNCKLSEQEAKTALVLKLYEFSKLTADKGAEILEITKQEFIKMIETVCNLTPADIQRDYEMVCKFTQHLKKTPVQKRDQNSVVS
ncbi:MAG: UPF0175 family protein [Planctomycetaceae bacterium]|jgi:hypothetical protein|nr:UPF0175 family protein [Planctomycetaceae bacterium]